jgi:hypothetical protein
MIVDVNISKPSLEAVLREKGSNGWSNATVLEVRREHPHPRRRTDAVRENPDLGRLGLVEGTRCSTRGSAEETKVFLLSAENRGTWRRSVCGGRDQRLGDRIVRLGNMHPTGITLIV